ncbi:hypothetical protein Tco_1384780 [Tanacetum coccineum]
MFSNGGVIVVEDEPDIIHVDNSYDLALSTSLNDLEIAALHIDVQSIDVDAPPDIIDVVDEDDDIINEEDPIPHDLADSDDEDLVNLDIDDGVNVMSADVARGHGGDGGGDDRSPPYQIPTGCGGCLGNRDKNGPVSIRFEFGDRETLMPLGEHAAHWANYPGELVRELPLHYPSWRQMPPERKTEVVAKIGTQIDLRPHMESDRWPQIYAGIQQHLQNIYNGKKAALKERHWVPDEDGTYDVERIRRGRPSHISEVDWDAQIAFWNNPKNLARAAQNKQNWAKSKVVRSFYITSLNPLQVEVRDFMRDGSLQLQARSQKYRKISSMTQRLRVWGSINVETQEAEVTSQEEMLSFLLCGSVCTTTGSTNMNSQSRVQNLHVKQLSKTLMEPKDDFTDLAAREYVRPLWLLRLHSFKPIVDIDNDQEVHASKFQELGALRT